MTVRKEVREVEITVKGSEKEIADLVLLLQDQHVKERNKDLIPFVPETSDGKITTNGPSVVNQSNMSLTKFQSSFASQP